jgi:hypothetical protein
MSAKAYDHDQDREAIIAAALDYIESAYLGDEQRMARCLHPRLAKRIVEQDKATGTDQLGEMGTTDLIDYVRQRATLPPPVEQRKEVTILDQLVHSASVKAIMNNWVDYMHLGRVDGRWVIINVLWELHSAGDQR